MRLKTTIVSFIAIMLSTCVFSQKRIVERAEEAYKDYAYIRTVEVLLKVAEKGYVSVDLYQKLANSYYFTNDMANAAKWYEKLINLETSLDAEYYFRYAQSLKTLERYEESDKWMLKFYELNPKDDRAKSFINLQNYLEVIASSSRPSLTLERLPINSELSDFGATVYNGHLIFASTRGGGKLYDWNEQPYLDLYQVALTAEGGYGEVSSLSGDINTKYHESSAALTPDGKTMYFTRNNYYNKRYKEDKEGINRLQLYVAHLQEDGSWGMVSPVAFNDKSYSVAHPTVNAQGTRLYFVSDMPGSTGGSDLYVSEIKSDGSLGDPTNLGNSINSVGQETFPFINRQGDLYFSSNGYPGLGGLDVYVVRDFESHALGGKYRVSNVSKPINSPHDDFAYSEDAQRGEGYFSSNRGDQGDDDIYKFTIPACIQYVEGLVKDKKSKALLAGSTVILYSDSGDEILRKTVGEQAYFKFDSLECGKRYLVRGEKLEYSADEERFTTPVRLETAMSSLILELTPNKIPVKPEDDIAKLLSIPVIYFDFDKYNIRYRAEIELQKVLAVLEQYPSMSIDIRSHTDCRGNKAYNEKLSEERAQSTRDYLISKGIAPERLTAKGYGESQPVNGCVCEGKVTSNCSEEEHQLNRRSEFIITKI